MLTPDRHKRIVDMIRLGSYAIVAAKANGIGESTYFQWTKRGREAEHNPDGTLVNPADQPYVEFAEAVKIAEAAAEVQSVGTIRQAGQTTWQAAAWYLERKYPDRWARKDTLRQEVSGHLNGTVEVDAEEAVRGFLRSRHDRLVQAGQVEPDGTAGTDPAEGVDPDVGGSVDPSV
jgi:transposase